MASRSKKDNSHVIAWIGIIIAFFVLGFIANASDSGNQVTGYGVVDDVLSIFGVGSEESAPSGFEKAGTIQTGKDFDVNISRYLFTIMIFLLIWSVFTSVGFPQHSAVRILFSIVVAILSMTFITPAEIVVLLASYSALGLTFTTIIPFMIMMFFSVMLLGGGDVVKMSVGKVFAQIFLWLIYGAFLGYRLIDMWLNQQNISTFMFWVTAGIFAACLLIIIFNRGFRGVTARINTDILKARLEQEKKIAKAAKKT